MEKCSVPQTDSSRVSSKFSSIGKEEHAVRASMCSKILHIFECECSVVDGAGASAALRRCGREWDGWWGEDKSN
jgi:hypothetical protein